MAKRKTTIHLSDEAYRALALLKQQDTRSMSTMIEVLIRTEAIKRGVFVPVPLKVARK